MLPPLLLSEEKPLPDSIAAAGAKPPQQQELSLFALLRIRPFRISVALLALEHFSGTSALISFSTLAFRKVGGLAAVEGGVLGVTSLALAHSSPSRPSPSGR